jgi:hypothetical protein
MGHEATVSKISDDKLNQFLAKKLSQNLTPKNKSTIHFAISDIADHFNSYLNSDKLDSATERKIEVLGKKYRPL